MIKQELPTAVRRPVEVTNHINPSRKCYKAGWALIRVSKEPTLIPLTVCQEPVTAQGSTAFDPLENC